MNTNKLIKATRLGMLPRIIVAALVVPLVIGSSHGSFAQQSQAKTFGSAHQACQALYDAVKAKNEQAVQDILGAGPELTSSGEADADNLEREHFSQKYQEMHRLVREPDGSTVLYIGAENWPFPIPLVQTNGKWRFDAGAGSQEILARKIGENETAVMHVCQALTKAQQDTQAKSADPVQQFAQAIVKSGQANPVSGPFHGYYFRTVAQEPVGVVLVAYPAEYRVTGVMTFVVVDGGYVYEKDLGAETANLAPQIQGKPEGKWHRVQVSQTTQPSQEEWTRCLQNDACHVEDLFTDRWDRLFGQADISPED